MNTPKTDELRRRWIEYIEQVNRMRWNIPPSHPDHKRFSKAFSTLMQIAQTIKSTSEIEEGDTVTNGNDVFLVVKVEDDRVYVNENTFYHYDQLRIKNKFK